MFVWQNKRTVTTTYKNKLLSSIAKSAYMQAFSCVYALFVGRNQTWATKRGFMEVGICGGAGRHSYRQP